MSKTNIQESNRNNWKPPPKEKGKITSTSNFKYAQPTRLMETTRVITMPGKIYLP